MTRKNLILASTIAVLFAILFFAFQQEFIIIALKKKTAVSPIKDAVTKKTIYLYYFKDNNWQRESTDVIWHSNNQITANNIISSWLTWAVEEKFLAKRIALQSAVMTPTNDLYISFDRNPFGKEQSTFEKWIFVESVLKTMRESTLPIHAVYLLVNYQELQDPHLDFAIGWPISGFFEVQNHSCN
jgi:hypothetical protein